MGAEINKWYKAFRGTETSVANKTLAPMDALVRAGKRTISLNRRLMKKTVDLSWVNAIEEGLVHLDNVLRNPRVTIEEIEEIVPIALSRKITVESVKHLAQHTNLIQSIDEKTGQVTPARILNIYKEESLMTYENKFLNTLIDRLFIFVMQRYEKLKEVARNEDSFAVDYSTVTETESGGSCKVHLQVEMTDVPNDAYQGGYSTWERIEKIKIAVESYKSSQFCQKMGNAFIRPPVMRTNAIMKNVDLKACLILWQFIEGYEKVGYDIYIADSAQTPSEAFLDDLGKMAAMQYMLLGYHTGKTNTDEIRGTKTRCYAPKILRKFNMDDPREYDVAVGDIQQEAHGYVLKREMPEDADVIAAEIERVIAIEQQYLLDEENRILEAQRAAEEAERRRIEEEQRKLEEQRLAAERKRELERIAEEKRLAEEKEKQLQALIEQQKREEEEKRFEEEEARKREERARAEAELQARADAERAEQEEQARLEHARQAAENLATAVPVPTEEELAAKQRQREEETAARLERERISAERAQRLRAERRAIESKPFSVIYAEYSKHPFYVAKRCLKRILQVFGYCLPKPEQMSEMEREVLRIETKLAAFEQEAKLAKKEQKAQERAEKARLDDLFDSYSSSAFRRFRRKVRLWLRGKNRDKR